MPEDDRYGWGRVQSRCVQPCACGGRVTAATAASGRADVAVPSSQWCNTFHRPLVIAIPPLRSNGGR